MPGPDDENDNISPEADTSGVLAPDEQPGEPEGVPAEVADLDPAAADAADLEEEPGHLAHDGLSEEEEQLVDGSTGHSDVAAERDEYLEALRRVKAEFDNYKKRTEKEHSAAVDKRVGAAIADLLPVLDACQAAAGQGDEGVATIGNLLMETLAKGGLEVLEPEGKPFDPNQHEAVLREEGDGSEETVVQVMRAGYTWRGRVLRPAMVKVRS